MFPAFVHPLRHAPPTRQSGQLGDGPHGTSDSFVVVAVNELHEARNHGRGKHGPAGSNGRRGAVGQHVRDVKAHFLAAVGGEGNERVNATQRDKLVSVLGGVGELNNSPQGLQRHHRVVRLHEGDEQLQPTVLDDSGPGRLAFHGKKGKRGRGGRHNGRLLLVTQRGLIDGHPADASASTSWSADPNVPSSRAASGVGATANTQMAGHQLRGPG